MNIGFEGVGDQAEEMLRWRERIASTQFRDFVKEHGVEVIDEWFRRANVAMGADLDGITIPEQETGERFNLSITRQGVGIQDGENPLMSLATERAREILDEFRTA